MGEEVLQANLFRHFSDENHYGFMKGVSVQITDRVFGESRYREGFWQFKLYIFAPEGLNARFYGPLTSLFADRDVWYYPSITYRAFIIIAHCKIQPLNTVNN